METPRKVVKRLQKVQKKQGSLIAADEQLLSACLVLPVDKAQPAPAAMMFGALGVLIATGLDKSKVRQREQDVKLATGALNTPFTDLPASKSGYTFAVTNRRVIVFDRGVKKYLTECELASVQISAVQHASSMMSIALREGGQVVAVTSQRQFEEMAEHFVASCSRGMTPSPQPAGAGSYVDDLVKIPTAEPVVNPYMQPVAAAPIAPAAVEPAPVAPTYVPAPPVAAPQPLPVEALSANRVVEF